jgi:hypothetical protein
VVVGACELVGHLGALPVRNVAVEPMGSKMHSSIDPVILLWEAAEPALETALHLASGVCREVREDAAVMAAGGFRPGNEDAGEVRGVVGDRQSPCSARVPRAL